MEVREPKYNFALCFEAPIPSNSSNSNRGGSGWTFPSNNGNGGPQEGLPMLAPLDATPLNTSFPTPVFNTPPNSGLPPPYVQPRPTLGQNFSTPPNCGPPPPYVQPTLGRPLKTPPGLQTPPNHGLPPGSGDSERPLGSASSNSFLTPGSLPGSARRPPSISFSTPKSDSGSSTQSDSQSTPESVSSVQELGCVIAAVVEGRGLAKGEVGVASIDLKQPVLLLSQYPDTAMYVKTTTKLLTLRPIEILMPNTISDSISKTKLFQLVRDQFTESSLTTIQRKYFNETRGLEYVRQLCAPEFNSVQMDVSKKYYALAAAAALLKYVEFIQNIVFAPSSLKISYHGSEKTTLIDVMTAKNLELLSSSRDPASPYSLAAVINFTKTKGGARLLRSNILEPPCHLETILLRQECIQELTGSQEMFYGISSVLKRFLNVDQLISMCVHMPKRDTNKTADRAITYVIYLKHTLELVPLLCQYLANATNPLLKAINEVLDDSRFEKILSLISTAVHDDTHYQRGALNMRTQKCFCIREGISGMLDITRKVHTEVIDDILLMTEQLADKFNLPIRSAYNTSRGFYLQLYTGEISTKKGRGRRGQRASAAAVGMTAEQLPSEFIKVTRLRNNLNFTTLDLLRLNNRANDSLDDIYRMTHIILKGLLDEIREHVGCLYRLSECVAMLDMLHSFAHSVTVSDYVCPEFSPDTLCIKAGRHPMLDKMIYNQPVPNNVYASSSSNLTIITGPNMSGKSTYLRQIALLQILAQMGCYVPAEYACFRIANQIFSRIGSDDDMEGNASAFMVELREMHYILQNIDSTGLVIIDELGRGTSVDEGMGYCFAFAERLLATNAFVFLATHFIEVTNLQALYPNVENYYFEMRSLVCEDYEGDAASSDRNMTHTHILTKGVTRTNHHYGLRLAELCLFPSSIVAHARQLVKTIKVKQALRQQPSIEARRSKLVRSLATTLVQVARNSQLDLTALRSYLKHLKTKYIRDMQRLSMEATLAGAMPSTEDTPTSADNSLQLSSTQQEQS